MMTNLKSVCDIPTMKTPEEQKAEYDKLYNLLNRLSSKSEEVPLAAILNGTAEVPFAPVSEPKRKKDATPRREGSVLSFLFPNDPSLKETEVSLTDSNSEQVQIPARNANLKNEIEEPAGRPAAKESQTRPGIASPEKCEIEPEIQTHSTSLSPFELVKPESDTLLESMMSKNTRKHVQKAPKPPKEKPPKEPKPPKEQKPPKEPRRARASLPRVFVLEEPLLSSSIPAPSSVPLSTEELPVSLYVEDIMKQAITGEFPHQCRFCKTMFSSGGQHQMHYYQAAACNRNAIQEFHRIFQSK